MGWLIFTLFSAFFNSLMDLFSKLSSGKIHNGAGATLICLFAAIPTLIYLLVSKLSGQEINTSKEGILFSAAAGLTVGVATIFALKMFSTGISLSIAVPVLRISMIIIASVFGVILLKEAVSWKLIAGLILSFIGLFLISASKS